VTSGRGKNPANEFGSTGPQLLECAFHSAGGGPQF